MGLRFLRRPSVMVKTEERMSENIEHIGVVAAICGVSTRPRFREDLEYYKVNSASITKPSPKELLERVKELEKDKARLDWLGEVAEVKAGEHTFKCMFHWHEISSIDRTNEGLRNAIDAAIKNQK